MDEYLQTKLIGFCDPKFDVLASWRVNASKYQVLNLLVCDLLDILVSIVSSKLAFSTRSNTRFFQVNLKMMKTKTCKFSGSMPFC